MRTILLPLLLLLALAACDDTTFPVTQTGDSTGLQQKLEVIQLPTFNQKQLAVVPIPIDSLPASEFWMKYSSPLADKGHYPCNEHESQRVQDYARIMEAVGFPSIFDINLRGCISKVPGEQLGYTKPLLFNVAGHRTPTGKEVKYFFCFHERPGAQCLSSKTLTAMSVLEAVPGRALATGAMWAMLRTNRGDFAVQYVDGRTWIASIPWPHAI